MNPYIRAASKHPLVRTQALERRDRRKANKENNKGNKPAKGNNKGGNSRKP